MGQLNRSATSFAVVRLGTVVLALASLAAPTLRGQRRVSRDRQTEFVDGHEAAAGEALVRFRREPPRGEIEALTDAAEVRNLPLPGARRIRSRTRSVADLVALLSLRSDVAYVEPNYVIRVSNTVPNDPSFPIQWFLSNRSTAGADIHAPMAWDLTTGSAARVIGLVDSGVDHTHVDLIGSLWTAPAPYTVWLNNGATRLDCPAGTHGYDGYLHNCDAVDQNGHGTAMAGIIGATGNNGIGVSGVNWRASIMDLRFIGPAGTGGISDAVEAIDVGLQLRQIFGGAADLRVLSNSWGSTAFSQALADEIAMARDAGVLFVAAAGNDARDNGVEPQYPASYDVDNVISVAATTETDGLASYSDFGATSVHLGAPGDDIATTARGTGVYTTVSGTSPATAVVSGVAGLVLSACNQGVAALKKTILQTVDPVPELSGKTMTGGRVNAYRALQQCLGGKQPPTVEVTSPVAGMRFVAPATIPIHVTAGDPDGTVTRVNFYQNSLLLGTDTTPFSITWTNVPAGTYTIYAIAFDNDGATATSSPVRVIVDPPAGPPPPPLPSGWSDVDVGAVGAAGGSASFDGTTYTVNGAGADVWGNADAFNFAFTPVTGDFDFSARVATIENVNPWTKAGLMVREGTGASARHAFVLATPGAVKGVAFQRRPTTAGASISTAGPATAPPVWLRLVRVGNVVTASYRRSAGDPWSPIGSQTFDALATTLQVGLAVSSHVEGTLATATFDDVVVSAPGWNSVDVGAVSTEGSATFDGSTFTVTGSGSDIWGTADAFHFAYQPQTDSEGNYFEIVARVTSVQNVNQWTKAGVMVRATTAAGAAQASLFVTPTVIKGVAFQRRKADGQTSVSTAGPSVTAPIWLKLIVSPNGVSAYYRTGTTTAWTLVGTETIDFRSGGGTIDAGLAVSSHASGTLATATFDNVAIRPLHAWTDRDIGSTALAGGGRDDCSVQTQPPCGAVLTLSGSGGDIWGAADAFHFHSTDGAQNGLSARVLSVGNTDAWAKAGVMIRDDLTAAARQVMVAVTPGKGIAMQYRAATGGPSAQVAAVAGGGPKWIRLVRSGSTFIGQMSADGMAWQEIGRVTVDMQPTAIGGLIVTSHDNARLATATFDDYYPLSP